jgi:hypothetical protein
MGLLAILSMAILDSSKGRQSASTVSAAGVFVTNFAYVNAAFCINKEQKLFTFFSY